MIEEPILTTDLDRDGVSHEEYLRGLAGQLGVANDFYYPLIGAANALKEFTATIDDLAAKNEKCSEANDDLRAENARLVEALRDLLADCDEYVRINNLYDGKGGTASTQTMEQARAAIAAAEGGKRTP